MKHRGTLVGGAIATALASPTNIDFVPTPGFPVSLVGGSNLVEVIFTNGTLGPLGTDATLRIGMDQIAFTTGNGVAFGILQSALLPGLFDAPGNIAFSNGIFRN